MADDQHGTGADNSGAGGSESRSGDDAPNYVTTEQLDEKLNKALSGRLDRFSKSLSGDLSKRDEALLAKFVEMIKQPPDSDDTEEDEDDASSSAAGGDGQQATDIERAIKKERERNKRAAKKFQDELEALKRERDEAKQANLEERRRSKARDALEAAGIASDRVKHALAFIGSSIRYDEDGELRFYDPETGDDHSLRDGVAQWAKTDDAKIFLPPKGAMGSGDRPRGGTPAGTNNDNPHARMRRAIGMRILRGG